MPIMLNSSVSVGAVRAAKLKRIQVHLSELHFP